MKTRSRKQPHKKRNTILSLLILLIAGILYLYFGSIPEELQEYLPEEVRSIFIKPTPTPALEITISLPPGEGNPTIQSFNKAKRLLMEMHIDAEQLTTFYCGSRFDGEKKVYHDEIGFHFYTDEARANRLEWEHVVPAHAFGQSFTEWREGHPDCVDSKGKAFKGRDCAGKMNEQFRYMESDMFNLRPAIGEVNGRRSNYSFTMIEGEKRIFGSCNMEIEDSKAEPPDHRFGDIARTYMYMESAYPSHGIISNKNEKLFVAWDKGDPVDAWECERNRLIEEIQGNTNIIVEEACKEARL